MSSNIYFCPGLYSKLSLFTPHVMIVIGRLIVVVIAVNRNDDDKELDQNLFNFIVREEQLRAM